MAEKKEILLFHKCGKNYIIQEKIQDTAQIMYKDHG